MKNLHLISTEKPSRLRIGNNGNFILGLVQDSIKSKNDSYTNQNIYITNLEEIKVGDWVFNLKSKEVYPIFELWEVVSYEKKIILTTDQNLIKDGVQAIDDKFLEWFVKNPKCEGVEIDKGYRGVDLFNYKIIIPKEEPKQETLEEASWRYNPLKKLDGEFLRHAFKKGAKWQQEQYVDFSKHNADKITTASTTSAKIENKTIWKEMYSEEDLREAFRQGQDNMDYSDIYGLDSKLTEQEWFNQFKK
jgi:hypothetical protein